MEAILGESLAIPCRVCGTGSSDLAVDWQKEGAPIAESADVRSFRRHRGEFVLRVSSVREIHLGNYTCILRQGGAGLGRRDAKNVVVSLLPPPPDWEEAATPLDPAAAVASTSRLLRWRGLSSLPIINYLLEVRLRPEAGDGEDWLSIVVPYQVRMDIRKNFWWNGTAEEQLLVHELYSCF